MNNFIDTLRGHWAARAGRMRAEEDNNTEEYDDSSQASITSSTEGVAPTPDLDRRQRQYDLEREGNQRREQLDFGQQQQQQQYSVPPPPPNNNNNNNNNNSPSQADMMLYDNNNNIPSYTNNADDTTNNTTNNTNNNNVLRNVLMMHPHYMTQASNMLQTAGIGVGTLNNNNNAGDTISTSGVVNTTTSIPTTSNNNNNNSNNNMEVDDANNNVGNVDNELDKKRNATTASAAPSNNNDNTSDRNVRQKKGTEKAAVNEEALEEKEDSSVAAMSTALKSTTLSEATSATAVKVVKGFIRRAPEDRLNWISSLFSEDGYKVRNVLGRVRVERYDEESEDRLMFVFDEVFNGMFYMIWYVPKHDDEMVNIIQAQAVSDTGVRCMWLGNVPETAIVSSKLRWHQTEEICRLEEAERYPDDQGYHPLELMIGDGKVLSMLHHWDSVKSTVLSDGDDEDGITFDNDDKMDTDSHVSEEGTTANEQQDAANINMTADQLLAYWQDKELPSPPYPDLDENTNKKLALVDGVMRDNFLQLFPGSTKDEIKYKDGNRYFTSERTRSFVILPSLRRGMLENRNVTLNDLKYQFQGLWYGYNSNNIKDYVGKYVKKLAEKGNLDKTDLNIVADKPTGTIGGSFGYQVGSNQYGTLQQAGGKEEDDENDDEGMQPMKAHFLRSHYGNKNSRGKAIVVKNVRTNADVIVGCEKAGVLTWLIKEGILDLDDVNVLLVNSEGHQDHSFKSTVHGYHSMCEDGDGKKRIIPVAVIADCDDAGMMILEKYVAEPFGLKGRLAWINLFPSRVSKAKEDNSKEFQVMNQSAKEVTKIARKNMTYLEKTELFQREGFKEELSIMKNWVENNQQTYPCTVLQSIEGEAERIFEAIRAVVKGDDSNSNIKYINK